MMICTVILGLTIFNPFLRGHMIDFYIFEVSVIQLLKCLTMSSDYNGFSSVLDNKETFLQFQSNINASNDTKNEALPLFFKSLYKVRNLRLADSLEKCHFAEHDEVNKVIRNLRWCNSATVLEDSNGTIYKMNLSCKNKFCYLCCRAKSAKLSSRMMALLDDKFDDRSKYSFYFLTLTLQHNEKVRRALYLKELKKLMNELYRSKVFKKHFTSHHPKQKIGIIQAFENKISKNGNHIHSHNLIMCSRVTIPIMELENLIRDKWKKLSNGSFQIKLDLVRNKDNSDNVFGAVKELFKYSIKTNDSNFISKKEADRIAYWMIKTKGQNMINARGLLRGHAITSAKCKYDEKPEKLINKDSKYYLAKSAELKFTHSLYKKHSSEDRKLINKEVKLLDMSKALDITDVADDIDFAFSLGLKADELFDYFKRHIEESKEACWFTPSGTKEVFDIDTGIIKRVERMNYDNVR